MYPPVASMPFTTFSVQPEGMTSLPLRFTVTLPNGSFLSGTAESRLQTQADASDTPRASTISSPLPGALDAFSR